MLFRSPRPLLEQYPADPCSPDQPLQTIFHACSDADSLQLGLKLFLVPRHQNRSHSPLHDRFNHGPEREILSFPVTPALSPQHQALVPPQSSRPTGGISLHCPLPTLSFSALRTIFSYCLQNLTALFFFCILNLSQQASV